MSAEFIVDGKINHLAIADKVRTDVLFGPDGTYWVYEDGVYRKDEFIIQRRVNKILGTLAGPTPTNRIKHIIDPELEMLSHDLPEHTYINVLNGMYNYERQFLEPHSPAFHSIVQLPIWYDPTATCPIFDHFLGRVCPQDSLEVLWEIIAYLLVPGNPFQKAILFYGPGSNGKSTFINVMEQMVGRNNCSNITLKQLARIFEPAELLGKQLNTVGDLDLKYHKETETFKKITGGDPITAQRKNKDPFTFINWAVPLFAANSFWASYDQSNGYFRRWEIVSFPNKVSERDFDTSISEMTTPDQLAGIFNKAMKHLPTLMKRGHFKLNYINQIMKTEFEQESDNVAQWLEDDDSISYNQSFDYARGTNKRYTYERYISWSQHNRNYTLSNRDFAKRLAANGYTFGHLRGERVVYGIEFKDK